ncbi:LPS-assembly protein LptD [Rhodocytophaga rosea]|uniref:LPS-assembly protein LptD n=1 Tax=Rhodocytophaga rosea TaxID=2704465 RepID=A0A6C0GR22_9BACT|nr:putative LPS assembly protein LptD [Rhodocytophaga rosea]QHT70518.1 LPS-assembly protein LptD [Rhodocytophaga rosea]
MLSSSAQAQIGNRRNRLPNRDSLAVRQDTVKVSADTLRQTGDIETTINYTAKDSIITDVASQITKLYTDAKVTYGEITLEAAYMEVDMRNNQVYAKGVPDSTGKDMGTPKFKNGQEEYEAKEIRYNFKTKRGVIGQVVTQQGEGFIHGTTVKKDPENNMYVGNGLYTTCNLQHPHFHIKANKIKVVHEKQVVTGPFNLVINDVPTPLGFAFGVFPFIKKKPNGTSGIIFPVYGEEPRERGFFLRNGGYYWAMSERMNMSFLGEIYSRGGWGLNLQSQYRQIYRYGGNLDLRYNRRRAGDEGFQSIAEDFWITWSHTPENRGGTGRFSASVNAGTSKYNQRNAYVSGGTQDLSRQITPVFNSNISYSNQAFKGAVTYGVNFRHDMNTQTGIMNLTLPDINLAVTRIYPFKRQNSTKKAWYETIGFSYNFNGSNRLTNTPQTLASSFSGLKIANASKQSSDIVAFNPSNLDELLRRAQIGARHSIPISMSLKLFKYFSVNPSFSYNETWYPQKLTYTYLAPEIPQDGEGFVRIDTSRGFHRSYSYTASTGLTTNIYGMFYFKNKNRRLEAIRHRMIPSVSLSYAPDFSRDRYGFYQNLQLRRSYENNPQYSFPYNLDPLNNPQYFSPISRFASGQFSPPGIGESGNIGFSLNNTFEAKLRPKSDSAGAKSEKVSILDNFNISSSYNLAADSLNLSPFNISARTKILKTDVNFGMVVDPYLTQMVQLDNGQKVARKVNEFAWNNGKGLGQITSANMYFSKSFSPGSDKKKKTDADTDTETTTDDERSTEEQDAIKQINANRDKYVDFNIPWTLSFSYSLNYSKRGFEKAVVSQTLSFNGDLKLTEKWKIAINSGYDFVGGGIINTTSINIHRDLHCWEMVASWIPFGPYQSYTFDIRVRASLLQDLKLSRRRTWSDRTTTN